jgi:uncharacterized protein (DUF952 family)
MTVKTIYKLMTCKEWEAARAEGVYRGSEADRRDGFIHLSTAAQIAETARKHFTGIPDLVLLTIDVDLLENLHTPEEEGAGSTLPASPLVHDNECKGCPSLRWEPARGGELFPHLYANLPVTAVKNTIPAPLSDDGTPIVPSILPA